jgi:hypothetical protein
MWSAPAPHRCPLPFQCSQTTADRSEDAMRRERR